MSDATETLNFAEEGEELRAFHLGQGVVDVGGKLVYHGDHFVVEGGQLLFSVGEEGIEVLLVEGQAGRDQVRLLEELLVRDQLLGTC